MNNQSNNFITRKLFTWTLGIFLVVIMAVVSYLAGKVDDTNKKFNHNFTEVKMDISAIQTDISWLKDNYKK